MGLSDQEVDKLLDPIYKDPASSAGFTSAEPLLREAQACDGEMAKRLQRADVHRYLARQRVYTLHRRVVRRFPRLRTRAAGLHTDWQADLADMQRLKRWNRGMAYLLVCVDVLSRQLFVQPVRSKRSADMIEAFRVVFKRCGYIPWRLMTDAGLEFTARPMQQYFKQQDLQHYCMKTSPLWHAGMAERAIRSIKERLYRYFTHRGTHAWVSVIQRIATALNSSPNSAIFGLQPRDVTFANAEDLRDRLETAAQGDCIKEKKIQKPRFKLGDEVRIEKWRHIFRKGYLPNFTNEVFTVDRVRVGHKPVTYRLRDGAGERLEGWFYANELCLVLATERHQRKKRKQGEEAESPIYEIEYILRRRKGSKGVEECLVKWKEYSEKHNSWIPVTSII